LYSVYHYTVLCEIVFIRCMQHGAKDKCYSKPVCSSGSEELCQLASLAYI